MSASSFSPAGPEIPPGPHAGSGPVAHSFAPASSAARVIARVDHLGKPGKRGAFTNKVGRMFKAT